MTKLCDRCNNYFYKYLIVDEKPYIKLCKSCSDEIEIIRKQVSSSTVEKNWANKIDYQIDQVKVFKIQSVEDTTLDELYDSYMSSITPTSTVTIMDTTNVLQLDNIAKAIQMTAPGSRMVFKQGDIATEQLLPRVHTLYRSWNKLIDEEPELTTSHQKLLYFYKSPYDKMYEIRPHLYCNNKCIHCFVADRPHPTTKRLSLSHMKDLIDKTDPDTMITLTGGEPTLFKDFTDTLAYTKSTGRMSFVNTNGRKFGDKDFADKACKVLDGALVSVHAMDPEMFEDIAQAKGSYQETWDGMENIYKSNSVLLVPIIVVLQKNYKHIVKIADEIQRSFPGALLTLTYVVPLDAANDSAVVPKYSDAKPYIKEFAKKWGHLSSFQYMP